ncbi:Protein required for ethanol metabolism [Apiotrichum porosum]|uniref:Protein required for ethanol metabolism n=1 Tax=Apiotrichum porosum TaxID=105984 RepID=A0A427Y9C7_9TREE|nr:Protein required for ethanol metabolism [Apiotrichum porosum]RSH87741.1 Protein required for ethanol metabolism [Apiotrichum porosum]
MSGLLGKYATLVSRYPYSGNMLQSAILFATGDVIAQQGIEKKGWKNHDYARTGRIVIWGGGCFAPFATTWFRFLQNLPIKSKIPATITRVALDQTVAAPIVLSTFFTVMTLLEGKDMNAVKDKWQSTFWPTLKSNWMLFVPFQAVNMIIPPAYRVLAINAVNIPWNAYLSLQNAKADRIEEQHHAAEMGIKMS